MKGLSDVKKMSALSGIVEQLGFQRRKVRGSCGHCCNLIPASVEQCLREVPPLECSKAPLPSAPLCSEFRGNTASRPRITLALA